jgi:hypothetical protein
VFGSACWWSGWWMAWMSSGDDPERPFDISLASPSERRPMHVTL